MLRGWAGWKGARRECSQRTPIPTGLPATGSSTDRWPTAHENRPDTNSHPQTAVVLFRLSFRACPQSVQMNHRRQAYGTYPSGR